jgi:putative CocE/NonD family hydrolase
MNLQKLSKPKYDVSVVRDVMVAMRDGVHLSTDIYFPALKGKPIDGAHPVVFHRTPYDKTIGEESLGYCNYFASRGYVAVIQDCRGTFESEGEQEFLIPEAEDGFDTMEWISNQSWSNGKVGSWGCSWASWTQTAMAGLGAKDLAAMVPNMSGSNAYQSSVRHGGALELRFLAWAFWHSATNTQAKLKSEPRVNAALNFGSPQFEEWLSRLPIRKGQTQLALVPSYEAWALQLQTESDYTDYWKHPSLNPSLHWNDFPDVPILLVGGWYDSYTRGQFENLIGIGEGKKGPVRLLMGPWTHGSTNPELTYAGDIEFDDAAALDSFRDVHLAWFDRALKGVDVGIDNDALLRIFVMGGGGGRRAASGRLFHGGEWRDEHEWPLARTRFTAYYLHGNGDLLASAPTNDGDATTYRFDPTNPVPSIGGNVSSLTTLGTFPAGVTDPAFAPRPSHVRDVMSPGGFNQVEQPGFFGCHEPYLPLGSRPDVLVFETPLLEADTEVTGPIEVNLWVSSSAVDTDFTAKLIDVYPPSDYYPMGYALNLTDSLIRLRYRDGTGIADFVPAGEAVEISITLYPTSNVFVVGHRIRLDISSSNFPRFDVNPNTGEPIGQERRRQVADNTIYHSSDRRSHVVLPMISR